MTHNRDMKFLETKFPPTFCEAIYKECTDSIESSSSFNLIGLPSVGLSFFLRYLTAKSKHKFVHINTYELSDFTKNCFFEQFASKTNDKLTDESFLTQSRKGLENLAKTNERIVIVINRIDRLGSLLDQNLFDNLRYLRDASREQVVMIFISSTPIIELKLGAERDSFNIHTKQLFFKPYSIDDLESIAKIDGTPNIKSKALELSGGHHSLFQILLRCQSLENPLSDPMVELVISDIFMSQNVKRREQLQYIALGKKVNDVDFLLNIGLIKLVDGRYEFFSELLQRYLLHYGETTLPHKEKKLLKILMKNVGKVVRKQDIFDYIWGDEVAGDWALNSLVYRLRRHRAFNSRGYVIKSVKKDGYILIDPSKQ